MVITLQEKKLFCNKVIATKRHYSGNKHKYVCILHFVAIRT